MNPSFAVAVSSTGLVEDVVVQFRRMESGQWVVQMSLLHFIVLLLTLVLTNICLFRRQAPLVHHPAAQPQQAPVVHHPAAEPQQAPAVEPPAVPVTTVNKCKSTNYCFRTDKDCYHIRNKDVHTLWKCDPCFP